MDSWHKIMTITPSNHFKPYHFPMLHAQNPTLSTQQNTYMKCTAKERKENIVKNKKKSDDKACTQEL